MSIILERIKKVNEINRKNIDKVLSEYNERVKAEMNGVPMRATWDQDFYMWRDGELKKIASKGDPVRRGWIW